MQKQSTVNGQTIYVNKVEVKYRARIVQRTITVLILLKNIYIFSKIRVSPVGSEKAHPNLLTDIDCCISFR